VKKYLTKKIVSIFSLVALLAAGAVGYSQNYFAELDNVLFRNQDPQIRYHGSLSFRTGAGTSVASINQSGQLAARRPVTVGTTATYALSSADCGRTYVGTASSGTQVYTLPAVTTAGCTFTFIAGHASGEILVDSVETSGTSCIFTTFTAVGTDADTGIVTDTDCAPGLKNTAATNAIGDSITIMADGVDTWRGLGIANGIWAAQ
jgi:hypothetical protein